MDQNPRIGEKALSAQWPHQDRVGTFYGNPGGRLGQASPAWEKTNLVTIACRWPLVTSWDEAPVRGIRIHKLCAESLTRALDAIWDSAGRDAGQIRAWGMHLYGGGYNYRLMRGGNRLSMHSWGCAVDFDPARNGFGDTTPNFARVPAVLAAFEGEGWTWGGRWKKPDGMHFQAARTA